VATLGLLLTEAAGLIRQTLDHLAHWQSMREFYQQMRTIHAEHTRIAAETADLSRAMLAAEMHGTSREGLIASPAALAGLAAAQRSLSDALDALERRMRTSLGAAGSLDPVAADTITETLAALNTSKPKLQMHTASDLIAAGQTAKASAVQREIDAALRDAIKQLGGDRRADLARQTARLRAAEKELAALINRQVAIDNEIERAIAEPDAVQKAAWWRWIAERQPVLRQDTLALAESLEQLRLPELASLSLRAADRMTAVTTAAVNPQQPEASQTAATASRAVLTYLVDARKSLARVRLQSQADLAAEDQLQVQLVLRRILKQQHQLLDETRAIDTSSGADRFTKVLALADHAAELANELAQLADSLTSMVAIELMIRSAAEDLTDAQRRLEQGDVDEATQSLIQQAIDHVERILTAIEVPTDQPTATPPTNDQHPQTSAEPDELPPGGVLTAAEVRLLLELQRTLNDRIAALADAETRGVAAPSLRAEYTATARQQTRLAECVIALLREGEDEASKLVRRLLDESRGDGAAPESPSLPSIHDSPTKTPQGPRFEDPLQAILGGEAIQPGITPTPAPPSPATDQPDQPNETETQPDDPLAQQLGTAGISEEDNPLLETARQMRTVASALDGERAAFALPIARQIVIDLELLLAQAKKAAASDPRREPRRPTAQPQPSGSGGGDPSEGAAAGMEGSNEMPPVTDERLRFLMRELWGQLPPKARAQLLQAPVEQFHPRYRRLIEQFYRRLGEQR